MEKENYAIFIHKTSGEKFATLTEKIIELEFNAKKWLWNLPKDTKIECYRIISEEITEQKMIIELKDLRLTMSINYNDLKEVFFIQN
ncbi:hypothetical protein E0I26_03150 [Flavobacterium rhamnosiphilum]|uniref:Uncharacterized protein n=1 Tax=Flavobacterium rhamnosiphilum TaxID=2541724 RepID=A0A4R5FCZ0_9FLAO|nr:hypothetical protein [Flavobacterium rhamnosiphilum]TDE47099.1 hypothetical protein E0I26_03150 [Flavobacterium rhamnosiphilum]